MTHQEFINSKAHTLLCEIDTKIWVQSSEMTDLEKKTYPSWETVGGYLKDISFKKAFQNRWGKWTEENRSAFTSLPNFNWDIFEKITGVKSDE